MDNFVNKGLTQAVTELVDQLSVEDEFLFNDIRIFTDLAEGSDTIPHPWKHDQFLKVRYDRFQYAPTISEVDLSEALRNILRHNQMIILGKAELDSNLILNIACFTREDLKNA